MRDIGALGRSREVPGDACPYCGYHFEMATQVGGDGRPEVGDVTICIDCAAVLVYDDEMLTRKPTAEACGARALLNRLAELGGPTP